MTNSPRAHFILIVGAMHGAWVWRDLVPRIGSLGHSVEPLELPGMGDDRSIAPGAVTLDVWADHVAAKIAAAPAPVILVGHSRGGVVIGEVAERLPANLAGLVYLTALIVPPGESGGSVLARAASGERAEASSEPLVSSEAGVMRADPALIGPRMYHRCAPAIAAEAARRLCPEPLASFATPASVTWERWGRVPRAFIECEDDRSLPLAFQRAMQDTAPCRPVVAIDADHSPFFSAPEALAAALAAIADDFLGGHPR